MKCVCYDVWAKEVVQDRIPYWEVVADERESIVSSHLRAPDLRVRKVRSWEKRKGRWIFNFFYTSNA